MTDTESEIIELARKIARRAFAKRGNHSEIHIKEDDLMVLIGSAITIWNDKVQGEVQPVKLVVEHRTRGGNKEEINEG